MGWSRDFPERHFSLNDACNLQRRCAQKDFFPKIKKWSMPSSAAAVGFGPCAQGLGGCALGTWAPMQNGSIARPRNRQPKKASTQPVQGVWNEFCLTNGERPSRVVRCEEGQVRPLVAWHARLACVAFVDGGSAGWCIVCFNPKNWMQS